MWTPGLLFLLLTSSCLPVSSTPPGASTETSLDEGQQKDGGRFKEASKKLNGWFKKHYVGVAEALVAGLEPVPGVGPPLAAAIKILLLLAPQADKLDVVNSELRGLNGKLDTFRAEMKWDAWAAGAYQIPVNNIEKAWSKYTELVRSYPETTNTQKEALKKSYFTFYSQYTDSTLVLHQFLTAKPESITQNLGDLLADRLKCHEKDFKAQFLYLNKLMLKGNMLNEKYREFKGTNSDAKVDAANEIACQSASALFTSHQRCLSDSAAYIERDIFERIDDTKKHQEIANSVMEFLAKTYDRYVWLVVAFTTQNSKHDLALLNRHVLSGFTEVERGAVTVAVAKQVKGSHTMADAVKIAIKECLPEGICLNVAETLKKCGVMIHGKRVSQTYTAVHAFKRTSQTATNAVEGPDVEDFAMTESSSLTSHLSTGECGKVFGKFMVLIKSDQELNGKEYLCSKVNCGQNGECVVVPGTFIAMCKCQYPYYGERCKKSFESYKRDLQKEAERKTQIQPACYSLAQSTPC